MQKIATAGLLLSALLLLASTNAQATKLYKWTDESGQVHYTQSPPTGRQANEMRVRGSGPTQDTASAEEQDADGEKEADPVEQMRQIREKNCEMARQNLQIYQQSDRVQQPDGTVLELDEATRRAKIAEAQAAIDEFCR